MFTKDNMLKAAMILVPTYSVAFMTEKMVYVVPMLATMSFLASSLNSSQALSVDADLDTNLDGEQ
jgi:hypothetical protein